MKYEVLKTCTIAAKGYKAGAEVELDDETARVMMTVGRVKPIEEAKPKPRKQAKKPEPEVEEITEEQESE